MYTNYRWVKINHFYKVFSTFVFALDEYSKNRKGRSFLFRFVNPQHSYILKYFTQHKFLVLFSREFYRWSWYEFLSFGRKSDPEI